jgi:flagellar biosynthetic protein FliQ
MDVDRAVELARAAILLALMIGAPVMLIGIMVGLIVSILQAVTQIQEQTLSFVPKIIAMFLTMMFLLPWTINHMIDYATNLIRNIPSAL